MKSIVRIAFWATCSLVLAALAVIIFVAVTWSGNRDSTRLSSTSPDRSFVAEIHTVTTPMHGGPDTLYVTIIGNKQAFGETVFSRVYECDDPRGFDLVWTTSKALRVSYPQCDTGRAEDNLVTVKQVIWRGIAIDYLESQRTAAR